jgi:hypothetical protein
MPNTSQISDPSIGGTYMTLLNTVANLGSKWPTSLSLFFLDAMTIKQCMLPPTSTDNSGGYGDDESAAASGAGVGRRNLLASLLNRNGGGGESHNQGQEEEPQVKSAAELVLMSCSSSSPSLNHADGSNECAAAGGECVTTTDG